MWPFKKKETEPKRDTAQEAIDDLRSFRKIGQKFNYMGVNMIVESHYYFSPYGGIPRIKAAYKNEHGEIKHAEFLRRELPVLRAENP